MTSELRIPTGDIILEFTSSDAFLDETGHVDPRRTEVPTRVF